MRTTSPSPSVANGQNVKLASELTGWTINLMTEAESERKSEAEHNIRQLFISKLDVDEKWPTS